MNILEKMNEKKEEIVVGDIVEIIYVNEDRLKNIIDKEELLYKRGTIISQEDRDKERMYNNTDKSFICCRKETLESCMKNSKRYCYTMILEEDYYNKITKRYGNLIETCYIQIRKVTEKKYKDMRRK